MFSLCQFCCPTNHFTDTSPVARWTRTTFSSSALAFVLARKTANRCVFPAEKYAVLSLEVRGMARGDLCSLSTMMNMGARSRAELGESGMRLEADSHWSDRLRHHRNDRKVQSRDRSLRTSLAGNALNMCPRCSPLALRLF